MNFLLQVRPFKILPTALLALTSITFIHPSQDRVNASDQGFSGAYTVDHVIDMVRNVYKGRVEFHAGCLLYPSPRPRA